MKRSSHIPIACFSLLLSAVSACSDSSEPTVQLAPNETAVEVDFAALIKTSDPVEVCTALTEEKFSIELGSDFLPENYERLSCECIRDGILYQANETVPGKPAVQHMMVQMAMNFEIIPVLFNEAQYPGGLEAFWEFLATDGKQELGFDDAELQLAMDATAENAAKYASEEAALAMAREIPSCVEASEMAQSRFPSLSPSGNTTEIDLIFAMQRLKHDPGISFAEIRTLATESSPEEVCPLLRSTLEGLASSVGGAQCTAKQAYEICGSVLNAMDDRLGDLDEQERLPLKRLAAVALYVAGNSTTSGQDDVRRYLLAQSDDLGFTPAQINRMFGGLLDVALEDLQNRYLEELAKVDLSAF